MPGSAQKTPIARTLEQFAQRKVLAALEVVGKSLPASVVSRKGAIVTVKFELASTVGFTLPNVTVPMLGAEFLRLPIPVGCKGLVVSADAYLGGMSGLGGGAADLSPRANLSSLWWAPLGNSAWTDDDPGKSVLYGPDGAIIRTTDKHNSVEANATGVTVTVGASKTVVLHTLPLAPPATSGALWNSSGTVRIVP